MSKIQLGLDLDSTIANFPDSAFAFLREHFSSHIKFSDWTSWEFDQSFGPGAADIMRIAWKSEEFWMGLEPIPGVIREIIRMLPDYEIIIVTDRSQALEELTHTWLCVNEVPFDHLFVVQGYESKIKLAHELALDAFVDDRQETVEILRDSGLVVGQLAWPWNTGGQSIIRCQTWKGLAFGIDNRMRSGFI